MPEVYSGLRFSYAAMEREIKNMREVAKPFLATRAYEKTILDWKEQLINFRDEPVPNFRWTLAEEDPLKTSVSKGDYEKGNREGRLEVFGTISGSWEITPEPTPRRGRKNEFFILSGIASLKLKVWTYDTNTEVARWSIDVGDHMSPGCHFHTQIDLEADYRMFPRTLSVPRFPTILVTPMDALDFLLGELFQDRWYERASAGTDEVNGWMGCQKSRLLKLLEWQRECFEEAIGSPWAVFKSKKPKRNIFSDDASRTSS